MPPTMKTPRWTSCGMPCSKLADRYAHAPAEELPLLFQRILQNTIRDHYRRSQVRNRWVSLFSLLRPSHGAPADGATPA